MINQTLATYADLAVYAAIVVLTLAMIGFAADLGRSTPRRTEAATPSAAATHLLQGASRPVDVLDRTEAAEPAEPARRPAAGIAMALSWLGGLLLLAAVVTRGLSAGRVPWSNMFEFSTTGSLAVIAAYLALSARRDLRWLGLFVVGPVLLTLGLAVTVFYAESSQLMPSLQSSWLVIHVSVAILATALFTIAFSVTILQLIKSHRETHPPARVTFMESLPSAAALDRLGYGLHVVAFPLWTFTLIAGAIWAQAAWGTYWQWDPKEVWTFVIWVVYAAYLHARSTSGWSTRSASYIALAGYACILINYMVVNVYLVGMHSYSGM